MKSIIDEAIEQTKKIGFMETKKKLQREKKSKTDLLNDDFINFRDKLVQFLITEIDSEKLNKKEITIPKDSIPRSINLYFQDLSKNSDKVYNVEIYDSGNTIKRVSSGRIIKLYNVIAHYGKRNGTLVKDVKGFEVSGDQAISIFENVVKGKKNKKYTEKVST